MISCILGKHSNTTMMLDLLIDSSLNGMSHVNYYYPLDCGIVKLLVNNSLIAETILMLSQLP